MKWIEATHPSAGHRIAFPISHIVAIEGLQGNGAVIHTIARSFHVQETKGHLLMMIEDQEND